MLYKACSGISGSAVNGYILPKCGKETKKSVAAMPRLSHRLQGRRVFIMRNDDGTFCRDCDYQLNEVIASSANYLCPKCGSNVKYLNISSVDGADLYDSWMAQSRDASLTGKRKVRWDTFVGWEMSHKLQRMVFKTRTIDRSNDSYQETVVDPKSGEVIHCCEEALSAHFGHGSAKSMS